MHEAIKLQENFPLNHLGYGCIVKFDKTSKLYKIEAVIKGEKISISDKDPKEVERRYAELINNIIDSKL